MIPHSLSLVYAAVHARSDGRVFSIWASRKIPRWRPFWGLFPFVLRPRRWVNFLRIATCRYILRRFMTGEMRNSSFGHRGTDFLVRVRLFEGGKVNPLCPANIKNRYSLRGLVFIIILMLSSGKKMSVDQFVNRLPKVVVKAGRVIDIRDSVRGVLQVRTPYSAPTFLSVLVLTHCSRLII